MALDTLGSVARHATPHGETERELDVEVAAAGSPGQGDYRCADCGYGIAVFRALPTCPMCRGEEWLPSRWSPFLSRHAD